MTSLGTHQELRGTQTAPIPTIPIYANINSGLFCIHIETRSPFCIPASTRAFPTLAEILNASAKEYLSSSKTKKSLSPCIAAKSKYFLKLSEKVANSLFFKPKESVYSLISNNCPF